MIIVISKTINRVWSPERFKTVKERFSNLPVIRINKFAYVISLGILFPWNPLNIQCDLIINANVLMLA